jgi:hypothetical protein
MPIVVFEHHLKDFDQWFALFSANPPPKIGRWRLARGIDDPNRVHVVGEMDASEVDDVKEFFESDKMRDILGQADAMSTTPIETIWLEDITPH